MRKELLPYKQSNKCNINTTPITPNIIVLKIFLSKQLSDKEKELFEYLFINMNKYQIYQTEIYRTEINQDIFDYKYLRDTFLSLSYQELQELINRYEIPINSYELNIINKHFNKVKEVKEMLMQQYKISEMEITSSSSKDAKQLYIFLNRLDLTILFSKDDKLVKDNNILTRKK